MNLRMLQHCMKDKLKKEADLDLISSNTSVIYHTAINAN